jgi:hypothetical protein
MQEGLSQEPSPWFPRQVRPQLGHPDIEENLMAKRRRSRKTKVTKHGKACMKSKKALKKGCRWAKGRRKTCLCKKH